MKKTKPRPINPCWYCGSSIVLSLERFMTKELMLELTRFQDVRDKGWYWCKGCGATAQEKPTSLGPGPKIMPWGSTIAKAFYRR